MDTLLIPAVNSHRCRKPSICRWFSWGFPIVFPRLRLPTAISWEEFHHQIGKAPLRRCLRQLIWRPGCSWWFADWHRSIQSILASKLLHSHFWLKCFLVDVGTSFWSLASSFTATRLVIRQVSVLTSGFWPGLAGNTQWGDQGFTRGNYNGYYGIYHLVI